MHIDKCTNCNATAFCFVLYVIVIIMIRTDRNEIEECFHLW